jgi:hypothetical protein
MTHNAETFAECGLRPEENVPANETAERIWATIDALARSPGFYEVVHETPLIPVPQEALPADLQDSGYRVLVKHEGMQPIRAYKLRGGNQRAARSPGPRGSRQYG